MTSFETLRLFFIHIHTLTRCLHAGQTSPPTSGLPPFPRTGPLDYNARIAANEEVLKKIELQMQEKEKMKGVKIGLT